jgi:hypothetical protein
MSVKKGFVRASFMERGYCFLRELTTGISTFAHAGDFLCPADQIVKNASFTYEILEYDYNGQKRLKAINITPIKSGE